MDSPYIITVSAKTTRDASMDTHDLARARLFDRMRDKIHLTHYRIRTVKVGFRIGEAMRWFHYLRLHLITSSARCSTDCGTFNPIAFAVRKLSVSR